MSHMRLSISTVPPDAVDGSVVVEEDLEGIQVELVVLWSPGHVVEITIPRGEVERGHDT